MGQGFEQFGVGPDGGLPDGMVLSVPWNHDRILLEALESRAGRFERLYAPFFPSVAPSCRAWAGPATLEGYHQELDAVCDSLRRWDAGLTLVANVPRWPVNQDALIAEAFRFAERAPRVRVVFADLAIASKVAPLLPGIGIGVSTTANVESAHEAALWKEFAGASVVTVARHVNRDMSVLKAIRGVGVELSVVSYDVCIPSCPFSGYHFQSVPQAGGEEPLFRHQYRDGCHPVSDRLRRERPHLLAIKEILPAHLRHYAGLVSEVKIPGRNRQWQEVLRSLDLYWQGTSLEHPYRLYSEPPEAWDKLATCDRNCPVCGYCERAMIPGKEEVFTAPAPTQNSPVATQDSPAVASQAPAVGYAFQRADGASVLIATSPKGPHRVIREVAGFSVHYSREQGTTTKEVLDLVNAVADELQGCGFDPEQNPMPKLRRADWPHGFKLN